METQQAVKHTPGPWHIETGPGQGFACIVAIMEHSPDTFIAVRAKVRVPDDAVEANARLIAAAPEMLEALKQFMTNTTWKDWGELRSRVDALIAKAEGR